MLKDQLGLSNLNRFGEVNRKTERKRKEEVKRHKEGVRERERERDSQTEKIKRDSRGLLFNTKFNKFLSTLGEKQFFVQNIN